MKIERFHFVGKKIWREPLAIIMMMTKIGLLTDHIIFFFFSSQYFFKTQREEQEKIGFVKFSVRCVHPQFRKVPI